MSWVQWVAALALDLGASEALAAFLGLLAVWVWPVLVVTLALGGLEAWARRLRGQAYAARTPNSQRSGRR